MTVVLRCSRHSYLTRTRTTTAGTAPLPSSRLWVRRAAIAVPDHQLTSAEDPRNRPDIRESDGRRISRPAAPR